MLNFYALPRYFLTISCLLFIAQSTSIAQVSDTTKLQVLDTLVITSTRLSTNFTELPIAVGVQIPVSVETTQQLSLKEQLMTIPGVYAQNAYNYAQDLRISIRGFGSRSSFGINGIKIIVDGVPETTPDGQGQLDNLNLGQIAKLEVIKSSSSAIYGNASGGVIDISTTQTIDKNFLELNTGFGSFGYGSYSLNGGVAGANTDVMAFFRYLEYAGYRDHSALSQFNGSIKINHKFSEKASISFLAEMMDSPEARDPGGLNLDEATADFSAARQANVDYNAGEAVRQFKGRVKFTTDVRENGEFSSYFFYNRREFDGRLPFTFGGIVDLDRNYFGQGSHYDTRTGVNKFKIGYDLLFQNDDRQRYENLQGEQGNLTFNQEEVFNNMGIYALDQLTLERFRINLGLRFDLNTIKAKDLNTQVTDNSQTITLRNLSPSLGLGYLFDKNVLLYANYSTGFKTPTLNQLSNRPDGLEGFNDLRPQLANNVEVGAKYSGSSFQTDITGFYVGTKDDLIPYELSQFPGRTFFRNVGRTERIGLEASVGYSIGGFTMVGSYTYSNFTYKDVIIDEDDISGNYLPGIPRQLANLNLKYALKDFEADFNINYAGDLFADDLNNTAVDGYVFGSLRANYTLRFKKVSLKPYVGVNNIFNARYYDNIRINAFGGRYYEPAPPTNFYGGLSLKIG